VHQNRLVRFSSFSLRSLRLWNVSSPTDGGLAFPISFSSAAGRTVFVLCVISACLGVSSCRITRQNTSNTKNTSTASGTDSLAVQDTSGKSGFANGVDSIASKVGGFFSDLFGKNDTTKNQVILTPPNPEKPKVYTGAEPIGSPGFISSPFRQKIEFDSNGNVTQSNIFLGGEVGQPITSNFGDYLQQRRNLEMERSFRDALAHRVSSSSDSTRPGGAAQEPGLLGGLNEIVVPLPPKFIPTIFGDPKINLRVSGDVAVHIAYRDNQFLATQGALFSGSETGLDFKQEVNISTNGTIGDKVKIGADWGSERSFQFENLLKLGYTGFPEEILQSVEAGNVNFTSPSQYIGTQQALFGVKAVTRFGPIYLQALAAQKKGERQTKTFGGGSGSSTQEVVIHPANYRRNRFFLDTSYIPRYEKIYSTYTENTAPYSNDPNNVASTTPADIEVWRSVPTRGNVNGLRYAVAHYDLSSHTPGVPYSAALRGAPEQLGRITRSNFIKLDTNQYSINPYTGVLTLSQEPNDEEAIAVAYNLQGGGRVGEFQSDRGADTLVLKLVKPPRVFQNPTYDAWKNILKNSYYVGGTGFNENEFNARIIFTKPDGHQIENLQSYDGQRKVISALGLDRYQNTNAAVQTPDGIVDVGAGGVLDKRTGTLSFPYLEPFGNRVKQYYAEQKARKSSIQEDLTFYFPELYTQSKEVVEKTLTKNNQISINTKFSGGTSSILNLNAFNVVEGSVKVSIGGRQLIENQDYRVDYNSGSVALLKPDLVNTGQVSVDYETHDIFTNATKNALGLRAELPLAEKGLLGMSFMNYSMRLPSLKTRQGEEPLSNWILGFDANYNIPAPFITDFLNYIPLLNLKDQSSLSLKADVALSIPNPNTQTSPMPADNGVSIAYLDDFEGDRIEFPLYMYYGRWVHASQPVDSDYSLRFSEFSRPEAVNNLKAKTYWFERQPQDVPIRDIKPFKSVARIGDPAQVLDVVYDPHNWGAYNHAPDVSSEPKDRWGGLMQYNPGLNITATNSDAIEFWMKIDEGDPSGKIYFDLGRISEDVIPDKQLQTEDKNGNAKYDPGEDVGLDTMSNSTEQALYPNAPNPNDPNNDNYTYTTGSQDYTGLNGTEGNQNDNSSNFRPDAEDMDGNGALNLDDNYFEYEIPLDGVNKYIIGQGNQGWKQYRIPLVDFKRMVGMQEANFNNISYYRLWFKGFDAPVHVRLHEIMIVGSQWTRETASLNPTNPEADNTLRLGYVNIEDNAQPPTSYSEPPGAQRDRLAGQAAVIYGNEQSLNMKLNNVPSGEHREAFRLFQSPNDIFNYRSLGIFVHGDSTLPDLDQVRQDTNGRTWVYVRFGIDKDNYYEYRRPLIRGWQNIHIDFGALTALKASRLNAQLAVRQAASDGVPGSSIAVVGSPALTNAPRFTVGVENRMPGAITTDIWWDELRLLDANDKPDYAMNASTQLKLAEFGRITASIVNERPDFHRVDERFNQGRSLNYNWNVTGEFSLQKFLPKSMETQSSIPLTISHTETILRPKYLPNTDIEIEGAIARVDDDLKNGRISQHNADSLRETLRLSNETMNIKNSIAATGVKLYVPGSFFILPAFVNRLVYGVAYAEEFNRTPQYEFNRAWSWTGSIGYELPPLPNASLPLLSWAKDIFFIDRYSDYKINFLPSRVAFAISATRSRNNSLTRLSTLQFPEYTISHEDSLDIFRSRVPQINRVFTATRGMQFTWKLSEGGLLSPSVEYGLDVTSNLVPLETYNVFNQSGLGYDSVYSYQRAVGDILRDIFFKDGQLVRPGRDYNTSQRLTFNTLPRLPYLLGLERIIRPIFNYRVDYRWQDAQTNLQNAKQAAWNNTITTGLEFNFRELGSMIFGKPTGGNAPSARGQRGDRGRRDESPGVEELPDRGLRTRNEPAPKPRDEARNQIERGEDMRPQSKGNPLGRTTHLLDTLGITAAPSQGEIDTANMIHSQGVGTAGERNREFASDTTLTPIAPAVATTPEEPEEPSMTLQEIAQTYIQKPLFDWNGTKFNFIQTNTSANGALQGDGSGITNFFTRGIFAPEFDANGPSRAYQLGLITDPHGRLLIRFKPTFPFVQFDVRHGDRASTISNQRYPITDVFTQQNNFELATSRPLWEGASLNLNWKVQFSYDERTTMNLNNNGTVANSTVAKAGEVSRTFFSLPPLPFLGNILQSGIERVGKKYAEKAASLGTTAQEARTVLSTQDHNRIAVESFMEGFETIPMFSGFLREYLPRLNYSFNWTGLEKFPLFSFADHASMRHGYNGSYRRSYRLNANETEGLTTLQSIVYGFRPLVAVDLAWDKFYEGRMTASLNYDTQTEWGADYSSQKITKRLSTTIGVTANYQRQGLSIPFLGLNLKNEFGASFTFSKTISSDDYFQFWTIDELPDGIGNGGLTKTTVEPRVSYSVSQQLTLEGFYRYELTVPSATGVLSPPTRLVMAGVDIRLKIQ